MDSYSIDFMEVVTVGTVYHMNLKREEPLKRPHPLIVSGFIMASIIMSPFIIPFFLWKQYRCDHQWFKGFNDPTHRCLRCQSTRKDINKKDHFESL